MESITNEAGFTFSLDDISNKYVKEKLGDDYMVIRVTKNGNLKGKILYYKGEPYMELPLNIEALGCKIDAISFLQNETKE